MTKLGKVFKDAKYLERIKDATDKSSAPDHPRHHGIKMQAHHAISAEGVKKSGLSKELAQFGYDINLLPNLVFIPSTLQGACHLGVQPHRGNHTAIIDDDGNDKDIDHPLAYHDFVASQVIKLKRILIGNCPADDPNRREKVRKEMNEISKKVMKLIQNAPARAPLTRIAKSFSPANKNGCGGADSVPLHSQKDCPVDRNHENQQGQGQKKEEIAFKKATPYQLQVGR